MSAVSARGVTRTWILGLGLGVLAALGLLVTSSDSALGLGLFHGTQLVALVVFAWAIRRFSAGSSRVWWLLFAGHALTVAGDLLYDVLRFGFDQDPFPGWSDVLYLSSYIGQFLALVILVNRLHAGRDREAWVDAAIMAVAAGTIAVTFILVPMFDEQGVGTFERAVGVAYPLLDLVVLAVLIRLLIGVRPAKLALVIVSVSVACSLVADLAYNFVITNGVVESEPRWVGTMYVLAIVSIAAAATLPSAQELATPLGDVPAGTTKRRLIGLVAAALTPTGLLVGVLWDSDGSLERPLDIATIVMFLLVLWRMLLLVRTVERQSDRLAELVRIDALTGLPNRGSWDIELERVASAGGGGASVVVAMLDLDRFKRYNDTYGHATGDRLLVECAGAWRRVLEPHGGFLARYGGEEFAVLLPGVDAERGRDVLDEVRRATPGGQTVSIGFAWMSVEERCTTAVERADRALYAAKAGGRDRVVATGESSGARLPARSVHIRRRSRRPNPTAARRRPPLA